jgi:hypothetical protein
MAFEVIDGRYIFIAFLLIVKDPGFSLTKQITILAEDFSHLPQSI